MYDALWACIQIMLCLTTCWYVIALVLACRDCILCCLAQTTLARSSTDNGRRRYSSNVLLSCAVAGPTATAYLKRAMLLQQCLRKCRAVCCITTIIKVLASEIP